MTFNFMKQPTKKKKNNISYNCFNIPNKLRKWSKKRT